ncbi:hypothetical protein EJP02_525 [Escherichia phage EJP2]|nr:hypothetical protein EJP02_525 [Escherichia phage EJP2]
MKIALIALALSVSSFAATASRDVPTEKFIQCQVIMTDENTGGMFTKPLELNPAMFKAGMFHEEDEKGSTTIYYDEQRKRGTVTVMDESSVTFTGIITCK